ncbi:hypothetical protein TraAM80_08092, partial [Trypanosoma rangeli]
MGVPPLSPEEVHNNIKAFLKSVDEPVISGSLVVYEFLDNALELQWSLARVLKLGEHYVQLQRWRAKNGSYADVLNALQKEKEQKEEEMRNCQHTLSQQRDELATVRRDTEARVARAKEEVENARRSLAAVEEVWLHEAFNARLPSAGLCLVLEASVAILNSDGAGEAVTGWEELRPVVRDPAFINRLLEYCPAVGKDANAWQDIVNNYQPRLLKLREQILRHSVNILPASPLALESVICDWVLAQLNTIIVFHALEKSQTRAKEIGEDINTNISRMKLLDIQIRKNAKQQHLCNEGYGIITDKNDKTDACLTFSEASDIAPITVPRSSITASIKANSTGVAVITQEESKRLLSRASMHRPLLYAALHTALNNVNHIKDKYHTNATLLQELSEKTNNVHKQNNDLTKQLKTANTEINKVHQELLRNKHLSKQAQEHYDQQRRHIQEQHDKALRQLQDGQRLFKDMQNKEQQRLKEEIKRLAEEKKQVENENANNHTALQQTQSQIKQLNQQADDLRRQLVDTGHEFKKMLNAHEEDKTRLINDLNKVNDREKDMKQKLKELRAENEQLREENEQLRAENEQLYGADEDKVRALEELNDRAEEMNRQLEELRAENEQLRAGDDGNFRSLEELNDRAEDMNR